MKLFKTILLSSIVTLAASVHAQEILNITADKKLDKEGRTFSLVVESDDHEQIQDFCLYTYHTSGQVERDCYGLPFPGDKIKVVEWRKMQVMTITVIDHGVFDVTYLENYFRKKYQTFRLVLLDSEGEWGLFVPQINERLRSLHFNANTRLGLPIGVRSVNYGY
jgi:chaperonin GroEL (HSP60 family)